MKTAIILFAHGSSVESANEAVRYVTAEVGRAGGFPWMDTAFLEAAHPTLPESIARMAELGAERVIVVPYFLTLGIHLQRDLPRIVDELSERHKGLSIEIAPPLDGHPALQQIVLERAQKALAC